MCRFGFSFVNSCDSPFANNGAAGLYSLDCWSGVVVLNSPRLPEAGLIICFLRFGFLLCNNACCAINLAPRGVLKNLPNCLTF